MIPTLAASVAVFALVFVVPGLAFLNLPSRRLADAESAVRGRA